MINAVYEQGALWGWARLREEHKGELIHVELRRKTEENFKPFASFVVIDGKIAYRMYGNAVREGIYDPETNTVTVLQPGGPSPLPRRDDNG